jgi:mannosylglycerate hydrolase
LGNLQKQIDNSDVEKDNVIITVFNPSSYSRNQVVTAVVDIPFKHRDQQYDIEDATNGKPIDFQEASRSDHPAVVRHLGDATMQMHSLRVHAHLNCQDLPALGYKTYLVKPKETFSRSFGSLVTEAQQMENDFLKVNINKNGTLDVTEKKSGNTFSGLHYFEDSGEAGHAWRHVPPAFDRVITTLNSAPEIELVQSGPLLSRYRITHKLQIPEKLDEGKGDDVRRLDAEGDDASRSQNSRELVVSSEITLRKNAECVEVKTTFDNSCKDHRLRVMFPTNLNAAVSSAEEPFDVVDRTIERGPDSPWRNTWNPTHPHQRFVDVSDGKNGLAIINDGLREYEVTDDRTRTIGVTLLRAFEVALTTVAWRWERHPQMTGSQGLGEHEFRYSIFPHQNNWDKGGVMAQAELNNIAVQSAQAGPHPGVLPKEKSFFQIESRDLALSALKKSEKSDGLIMRLFNPTDRDIDSAIKVFQKPQSVSFCNLNEEPIKGDSPVIQENKIMFTAGAKKIITLEISF